jgi:hypothetical protein
MLGVFKSACEKLLMRNECEDTWKILFGVLREMPGFKDQNIEVFANF